MPGRNSRSTFDHLADVCRGVIPGESVINQFGRNTSVGTSSFEDIWYGGGEYLGFLTSASRVRVAAGGNAQDSPGGTGCHTVRVFGLDENFLMIDEIITTNGTSASDYTQLSFMRVYRVQANDMDSYGGTTAGDITIENEGGVVMSVIESGAGKSEQSIFTVPAGNCALLHDVYLECDNSAGKSFDYQTVSYTHLRAHET